jgi:hypothetical protein
MGRLIFSTILRWAIRMTAELASWQGRCPVSSIADPPAVEEAFFREGIIVLSD